MEEYIEEAENVCLEEDLLESYDKELAFKEECYKEGFEEGYKIGFEEETRKVAKKLLKKKMDLNIISESTGLSMDELKKLEKEL